MNEITEEEARKKWCPMATITAKDSNAVGNREYGKPVEKCIASDCMMWRWQVYKEYESKSFQNMGEKPSGDGWECVLSDKNRENFMIKSAWKRRVPSTGYCGLSGSPR